MTEHNTYVQKDGDLLLGVGEKQYVLKIRDMVPEDKPREKLMQHGPAHLSVAELLAVVLAVGTKKEEVLAMSHRLMKEYGDTGLVDQKDPKKLEEMLDIPIAKACQIVACFELGRRFFKNPNARKPVTLRTATQVYEYLKDMRDLQKETLRGLYLDAHYMVIHDEVISIGSLTSNIVHPREVFRPALEYSASAVILVHNHPSGVATPSDADIRITRDLVRAGQLLKIEVLDHIILGRRTNERPRDFASLRELGYLFPN